MGCERLRSACLLGGRAHDGGSDLGDLFQGLHRVLGELMNGLAAVLVVHHLGEELRRNGDDVGPRQRRVLDVHDRADASDDDAGRAGPIVKPAANVADHDRGIVAFIGHAAGEDTRGTLNLLLANRNGFVIAADSRRSRPSPFAYWDDSQKLFRVGPKSAAVISGFASWVNGGSPIDFQVAAALREEFSDTEWEKGKRKLPNLPPTLMSLVGEQLTMFAGLLAANGESPTALNFQMLAAGFDKSKLVLLRLEFRPHIEVYGPFGLPVPRYEPVVTTKVVRHFECLSAGVDDLARSVLDGGFSTIDPRILEYYRARNEGKLDQLSLNSLEDLAVAILEETKRVTPVVGGPDQIGVFPKHGSVRWHLPELPGSRQKLRSTVLNVGASYSWEGFPANEHSQMRGKQAFSEISMSLSQPVH